MTLILMMSAVATGAAADERPRPNEGVQLKLALSSASPLPYQAVRLRLCVVNGTSQPVGPIQLLDFNIHVHVKGPGEKEFKQVREYITRESVRTFVPTSRVRIDQLAPLMLKPGEEAFLSFPVAAAWTRQTLQRQGEKPRDVWVGRPLFPEPGKYTLKCLVGRGAEKRATLEQVIDIEVGTPRGDDERVFQLLKKDEPLTSALLCPVDRPDGTLIPKLKDLVQRFPKSSYVDYARFALARGYRRGIGVDPPSDRVSRAMAADQLQKIVENRWDSKLEKVVPSNFAYLPNALIHWKSAEPIARESTLRRLDRVFPDSVEWLEEFAVSLTRADERRKDAEFVLDKKFPSTLKDPLADVKGFIADSWKTYRKRTPMPEEEPRRIP